MTAILIGGRQTFAFVLATLLWGGSTSSAQERAAPSRTTDRAEITTIIRRWEESWNRHDMHAFANLFHEDGTWILWTGQVWKGRAAIEGGHAAVHKTIFRIACSANSWKS